MAIFGNLGVLVSSLPAISRGGSLEALRRLHRGVCARPLDECGLMRQQRECLPESRQRARLAWIEYQSKRPTSPALPGLVAREADHPPARAPRTVAAHALFDQPDRVSAVGGAAGDLPG